MSWHDEVTVADVTRLDPRAQDRYLRYWLRARRREWADDVAECECTRLLECGCECCEEPPSLQSLTVANGRSRVLWVVSRVAFWTAAAYVSWLLVREIARMSARVLALEARPTAVIVYGVPRSQTVVDARPGALPALEGAERLEERR